MQSFSNPSFRYLYNEEVTLQSVMTALTTLYAAHKYMCPGLAKVVVRYLKEQAGSQFDPRVIEVLTSLLVEIPTRQVQIETHAAMAL